MMQTKKKKWTVGLMLIFLVGCAGSSSDKTARTMRKPSLRFEAGMNKGGITDNTDMEVLEYPQVDGFTGATRKGFHFGSKALFALGSNKVETGLDLMYNNQSFTYNDPVNGFMGQRDINMIQLMAPLTYNLSIFRQRDADGLFRIKLGWVIQMNLPHIEDQGEVLPEYSIRRFSNGPTFGVETTPVTLNNGACLGIYLDAYRGSRVFEDFYNRPNFEMPGSSYYKIGIIYQFPDN